MLAPEYIFADTTGPSELAQQKQLRHQIAEVLMKLSEDERETIVQHLYADLTFQEIADARERPLGTITSWYRRGIEKMQGFMEK